MIVVPLSIIILLVDRDIGTIDPIELAERNLLGKLVNQRDEHVLGNEREVSDESLKRPPSRRTRESTLPPDILVMEFSGHWTRTVDIMVEAVKETFQELRGPVNPCSPPRIEGEHGIADEKREIEVFEKRCCLSLQCFEDLFARRVIR